MRKITYWKCDAKASAKIIASLEEWDEKKKKAQSIAKSIGAVCPYFSSSFGSTCVSGFQFKEPPANGFKRLKGTTDGYAPRAGTELEKELRSLVCYAVDVALKLVGVEQFTSCEEGFFTNSAGLLVKGKIVYLATRGVPTKGGKRISDLEFEKMSK